MKPARVLITGGAGFIGYHLARRLLSDDHHVDLIDNFSRGADDVEFKDLLNHSNVRFFNIDLLDPKALFQLPEFQKESYDFIFHFAALIGVKRVLSDPFSTLYKNVTMLNHLIHFSKEQPHLKRFIFSSTSEVYAGTLRYFQMNFPTPEETPLAVTELSHPRTAYMLSKMYGEALCHYSGLPFTIVRPHNIYGTRMGIDHVIPELLIRIHQTPSGSELALQNVSHSRTFCFVEDAVEMIVRLFQKSESLGKVLNIGRQCPEVTIAGLATEISRMMKKKMTIVSRKGLDYSPPRRCPEMTKTRELTKYNPQIDLTTGLQRTYEWYRAHF